MNYDPFCYSCFNTQPFSYFDENPYNRFQYQDSYLEEYERGGKKRYSNEEAASIAEIIGIDFNKTLFDLEQFRMGLDVELEHGTMCPQTNVTNNDPIETGKIALVHLYELPDYYTRLKKMEDEGDAYWSNKNYQNPCF